MFGAWAWQTEGLTHTFLHGNTYFAWVDLHFVFDFDLFSPLLHHTPMPLHTHASMPSLHMLLFACCTAFAFLPHPLPTLWGAFAPFLPYLPRSNLHLVWDAPYACLLWFGTLSDIYRISGHRHALWRGNTAALPCASKQQNNLLTIPKQQQWQHFTRYLLPAFPLPHPTCPTPCLVCALVLSNLIIIHLFFAFKAV